MEYFLENQTSSLPCLNFLSLFCALFHNFCLSRHATAVQQLTSFELKLSSCVKFNAFNNTSKGRNQTSAYTDIADTTMLPNCVALAQGRRHQTFDPKQSCIMAKMRSQD